MLRLIRGEDRLLARVWATEWQEDGMTGRRAGWGPHARARCERGGGGGRACVRSCMRVAGLGLNG